MRNFVPSNPISRVRYRLRRHGVRSTIGEVAQHVRKRVYNDNTHVWYELPLGTDRPRLVLPPGLTLVRGGASDLPLLDEIQGAVSQVEAELRMEVGDELWLVLEGRRPAFVCWILHNSLPMPVGWYGQIALPSEIVCFEDSVTSASYRGRGIIGPPAWSQIADRLEKTGAKSIITKVEEGNKVMRWAIVKCGFREIATMHFRRVGFRQRTTLQAGTGAAADWLAGQLQR